MWRHQAFVVHALLALGAAMPAWAAAATAADEKNITANVVSPAEIAVPTAGAMIPTNPSALSLPAPSEVHRTSPAEHMPPGDYSSLLFVFMLATFIGLGVILRVSRLLHTPLMSLTNAISAIAVVGSIIVTGREGNPIPIRILGAVALFASMTNIVSGFLITDRMLKMFKSPGAGGKR
ncbi:MAG TPA: NAD(P) transhydrogenase subunit alpha [Pirellulales bacterium]